MEKCGPRWNQTKYISLERFEESYSKMLFLLNLSHCVKSYGHLCQIYQNHSSDMVMSRDPGLKFRKFLFFA